MAAAKAGQRIEARRLLEQVLEIDDNNEQAWLVLASVVDTLRERRICLENVLEINPGNERARQALEKLGPESATAQPASGPASGGVSAPAAQPARPGAPAQPKSGSVATPGAAAARPAGARPAARRRRISPLMILIAVLALILVGAGALVAFQPLPPAPTPTPVRTMSEAEIATAFPQGTPTPRPIGTIVAFQGNPSAVAPSWTPSVTPTPLPTATPTATLPPVAGYQLVFTGEGRGKKDSGVYTIKADGSGEKLLTAPDRLTFDPAWSPNGKRLAYVGVVDNKQQLFVAEADGSQSKALTALKGEKVRSPAWSSDGARIAYVVEDEAGNSEIYGVNADGTGNAKLVSTLSEDTDPAWSPDGTKLAYASDPTNRKPQPGTPRRPLQIFVRDLKAGTVTQLTEAQNLNYSPAWSPDGKSIIFVSTRNRFAQVFIMRPDGSDERPLTPREENVDNLNPAWSPDGNYIAFASNRNGGIFNLFVMTPDGKNVRQITNQKSNSNSPKFRPGAF